MLTIETESRPSEDSAAVFDELFDRMCKALGVPEEFIVDTPENTIRVKQERECFNQEDTGMSWKGMSGPRGPSGNSSGPFGEYWIDWGEQKKMKFIKYLP